MSWLPVFFLFFSPGARAPDRPGTYRVPVSGLICALEVVGDGSGGDAADRGCVSVGVGVG